MPVIDRHHGAAPEDCFSAVPVSSTTPSDVVSGWHASASAIRFWTAAESRTGSPTRVDQKLTQPAESSGRQ